MATKDGVSIGNINKSLGLKGSSVLKKPNCYNNVCTIFPKDPISTKESPTSGNRFFRETFNNFKSFFQGQHDNVHDCLINDTNRLLTIDSLKFLNTSSHFVNDGDEARANLNGNFSNDSSTLISDGLTPSFIALNRTDKDSKKIITSNEIKPIKVVSSLMDKCSYTMSNDPFGIPLEMKRLNDYMEWDPEWWREYFTLFCGNTGYKSTSLSAVPSIPGSWAGVRLSILVGKEFQDKFQAGYVDNETQRKRLFYNIYIPVNKELLRSEVWLVSFSVKVRPLYFEYGSEGVGNFYPVHYDMSKSKYIFTQAMMGNKSSNWGGSNISCTFYNKEHYMHNSFAADAIFPSAPASSKMLLSLNNVDLFDFPKNRKFFVGRGVVPGKDVVVGSDVSSNIVTGSITSSINLRNFVGKMNVRSYESDPYIKIDADNGYIIFSTSAFFKNKVSFHHGWTSATGTKSDRFVIDEVCVNYGTGTRNYKVVNEKDGRMPDLDAWRADPINNKLYSKGRALRDFSNTDSRNLLYHAN